MTPSRLKFTIKMLNMLIVFKNNFFLTFRYSENVWASNEISLFIIYNYITKPSGNTVLCGDINNVIYGAIQLINIVIRGGKY